MFKLFCLFLPVECHRFQRVRRALGGLWARVPRATETEDICTVERIGRRCPWLLRSRGWIQLVEENGSWLSLLIEERY